MTTSTTTSTAKKTTKATTETPIATKKDEQKAAVKATVTYNGFSDTNSVEMKMSDGSYEVMIVGTKPKQDKPISKLLRYFK